MTQLIGHVYPVLTRRLKCRKNVFHLISNVTDTSTVARDCFRMKRVVLLQRQVTVGIKFALNDSINLTLVRLF